ncbi:MAG: DUF1987 domain-containing protein [Bacteroidia bacterium]|nr:DUF1987 domain-containing protein [Bacteroidia bacterium]
MRLFIGSSSYQPLVLFDLNQHFLRIDGMSNMTNAAEFYKTLSDWISAHKSSIEIGTELVLRLLYLNSSSNKAIYHFFLRITHENIPVSIVIVKSTSSDNEDVVELLEQICRILGLPYIIREEP